jgi:thiamine-phosphate pyrophosphorylase
MNPSSLRRILITDRALAPDGDLIAAVARAVARAGATMVVVRELDLPDAEQVRLAAEIARAVPTPVLLARHPRLALEAGAEGVQLGWGSPPPAEARAILGPDRVVGASVHSVEEGLAVAGTGVDYLLLGPVFPTPKPHGLVFPIGVEAVRKLAEATKVPVVAVGGIDDAREAEVLAAGAAGVAAIRAFMRAGAADGPAPGR